MIRTWLNLLLLFLASATLAACTPPLTGNATSPPIAAEPAAVGDRVVLSAARRFAVAELAYLTAADGVRRLVDEGVIRGDTARWVRLRNREARAAMVRGKGAVDAAERASAAAELLGIADRFNKLIGRR